MTLFPHYIYMSDVKMRRGMRLPFGKLAVSFGASLLVAMTASAAPAITFTGNSLQAVEVTPERSTGLDKIYVLYDVEGVKFSIPVSNISTAKIYRYSNLGGAYAEEINNVEKSGNILTVLEAEGNMGYIVEDGDMRYYYWLTEYKPYRFSMSSLTAAAEQQCEYTVLDVIAAAEPIHYYTINGQQKVLDRELRLTYDTQEWDDATQGYVTRTADKIYESLGSQILVTPPAYCSTSFTLSGDRFLESWNWGVSLESDVVVPHAVAVHTEAEQIYDSDDSPAESARSRRLSMRGRAVRSDADASSDSNEGGNAEDGESKEEGSNQITGDDSGLGGSAPAEISFRAYATEGVIHHEWQISTDPEFENPEYRFNQQDLDYTFIEEGTFYVKYIGSNADGTCEAEGDVYTVSIGGSELLCPNAFTPNGDGVNDKWKVSYRSLLDFKCWIFDRYGHQMYYFDNPDDGWDGMRGDKPVKPGVYYYVVQATGADGKKYKKSGDINIIRHVDIKSGTESEVE